MQNSNWATEQGYTGHTAATIARRIRLAERTGASKAAILSRFGGTAKADRAMRDWAKQSR